MIAGASSQLLEYNVQLIVRCDEEARIPRAQQQGIEIGEQQTESQGIREGILHKTLSHWQSLRC